MPKYRIKRFGKLSYQTLNYIYGTKMLVMKKILIFINNNTKIDFFFVNERRQKQNKRMEL